jgi:RNA polymerase sigma factor (sigma-70 family)
MVGRDRGNAATFGRRPAVLRVVYREATIVEDWVLVEQAKRGSKHAFSVLVSRHERVLYSIALAMLRSSWDAADAVQDAFLEAYRKIDALKDPSKFNAWTARILCNKCRDIRRKRHPVPMEELPESCAFDFLGRDTNLDIMNAVRDLDEIDRTVVALRFFRDLKVDEIAEILGCPAGTVKSRINRAVAKLRYRAAVEEHSEVQQ